MPCPVRWFSRAVSRLREMPRSSTRSSNLSMPRCRSRMISGVHQSPISSRLRAIEHCIEAKLVCRIAPPWVDLLNSLSIQSAASKFNSRTKSWSEASIVARADGRGHEHSGGTAGGDGGSATRHGGLILAGLCLAAFIISLDTTIVNVALPSLVRELGATTTGLQWVVDAYNLAFAALVLAAGGLSDRLGRKGMLLAGLAVFGASSWAGSFATTVGQLIAARAVMGLGAAMMFPSTLSLLTNVFTERRARAVAIGLWGASAGVGVALGPIAGGWLLERFWWGSIFLFMVPIAAVVALLVAWRVPTSRDPRTPPVDWRGFALSTAAMTLIIYGIIQAPGWGWGSAATIGTLAAGAAVLAVLVAAERATAHPMIDVQLFRNPRFTAASGAVAIAFFALLGFIFLMTQYFQVV